jgi:hypothetical protein
MADLNVLAAKSSGLLPEPATSSTLPLRSTTAWMPRTGELNGITCQAPLVQAAPDVHAFSGAGWVASSIV